MLSSYKLPRQKIANVGMAKMLDGEQNLVPQILGNEKKPVQDTIKILEDQGAVGIDINMGCPVKKALKHNYGVSLMGDPEYAAEVVSYAVDATKLPVSVKFRAGIQNDLEVLESFALGIQRAGASWVTLHPRTSAQKRRGRADWSQILHLKKILKIPVLGNGDVQNLGDFKRLKDLSGCDAVMVGRALTVRPWLLWQVCEDMGFKAPKVFEGQTAPKTSLEEGQEFGRHLLRLIDSLYEHYDEKEAMKHFRFYLRVAHVWLMFGHDLARKSTVCKNKKDCMALVEDFFSRPQKMSQSTMGGY
jgi:nifR3 family TIM-barrel protein